MSAANHEYNTMEYASVSWEDNDSMPEISLDNPAIPGKYKSTVTNIFSKHCSEIKNTTDEFVQPITTSKKKLKDLIAKHNNEIFSFLSRPDKTPHVLGIAETIFRRYGQDIPTIKGANANSVLRDLNLSASMDATVAEFDEGLKQLKTQDTTGTTNTVSSGSGGGLEEYMKQTRWIYNQYKVIGEEVLRLENTLFQKLELLDKLNNRIPVITSLMPNEALPGLIDSFAKYAETAFQAAKIDESYKELVEAYKKWNICRQIVTLNNSFKSDTHEAMCAICLTDPVASAIVPCGHTFCANCAKKQNTTCYICRGTIRERIKLFFT